MSKQMCYNIFGEKVPYVELLKASGQLGSKEEQLILRLVNIRGSLTIDEIMEDLEVEYSTIYTIIEKIIDDLTQQYRIYNKKVKLEELEVYIGLIYDILMFKKYEDIAEELLLNFRIFSTYFKGNYCIEILTPHFCDCSKCTEKYNEETIYLNDITEFVDRLADVDDMNIEETPLNKVIQEICESNGARRTFELF